MKKGCIQGIFSKKHLKNDSFTPSNNKLMVTITKFITGNSFVLKPCVPKVKNCFENNFKIRDRFVVVMGESKKSRREETENLTFHLKCQIDTPPYKTQVHRSKVRPVNILDNSVRVVQLVNTFHDPYGSNGSTVLRLVTIRGIGKPSRVTVMSLHLTHRVSLSPHPGICIDLTGLL